MSTRIPVLLVAGFLGAGKTTLMRRLILNAREKNIKIAVIVNEFGASDVDSNILRELEREAASEILSGIAGGCACCSGQDELHETLIEIGERTENRPDMILLEASGLADPVLLLDVLTAAQLLPLLEIGGMISVADASRVNYLKQEVAPLLRRQTQLADLIVFNKTDVAQESELFEAQKFMRELAPRADVILTTHCDFDLNRVWNLAQNNRVLTSGKETAKSAETEKAAHAHYQTAVVALPHPARRARLEAALQGLPPEIWRAKGFVRLQGEAGLWLVQYTGGGQSGRYTIAPFYQGISGPEPETSLVFIGPALNRPALLKLFRDDVQLLAMY